MKNIGFLAAGLLSFNTLQGQATPNRDTTWLSLDEILNRVEQAYPLLQQYDERIKAIEQQAAGATAWMAPMFSISPSNFSYRTSLWKENSLENQAGVMFSLSQTIPNPSRLNAQRNYYASLATIERNNQLWTKNTLRTAAKLLFIQRMIAEHKLSILAESQELLQVIIKTAEEKYVYNQSELGVLYKARARLGDLFNMQQMQLSTVQAATIGLNTLMNQDVALPFRIDTTLRLPDDASTGRQSVDSALYLNRNDIRALTSTIQSMRRDQLARAAMRKPDFTIGITHNQMLGMPKSWSIMGGITLPIVPWSSKGWKSEIRMLDFEISALQRERETMQLMARQMIAEKRSMLHYEKKQFLTYGTTILPALRKNVETALVQNQQTTGALFVLLDTWEMLLMKRMQQQDQLGAVMMLAAQYEFETEKRSP